MPSRGRSVSNGPLSSRQKQTFSVSQSRVAVEHMLIGASPTFSVKSAFQCYGWGGLSLLWTLWEALWVPAVLPSRDLQAGEKVGNQS